MKKFVFLVACLAATTAGAALPDSTAWEFNVFLDEKKIGSHDFMVRNEDGIQIVDSEASFDVKLLFINVFSYRHQNREVWEGDCLSSISAETDANGKDFSVKGRIDGQSFQLENASLQGELPACVKTFAYWNHDFLATKRLLNSQTGEFEDIAVFNLGSDLIEVAGQEIEAIKYRVSARSGDITLWYSASDKHWLALESVVNGGRILRYIPLRLPTQQIQRIDLAQVDFD